MIFSTRSHIVNSHGSFHQQWISEWRNFFPSTFSSTVYIFSEQFQNRDPSLYTDIFRPFVENATVTATQKPAALKLGNACASITPSAKDANAVPPDFTGTPCEALRTTASLARVPSKMKRTTSAPAVSWITWTKRMKTEADTCVLSVLKGILVIIVMCK